MEQLSVLIPYLPKKGYDLYIITEGMQLYQCCKEHSPPPEGKLDKHDKA
ncbi:hypothetical protein NQ117_03670 [Paenibacillus sp. SC116]|nr:hypothetical protein [Paenibacillus sp. SC116]